MDPELDPEPEVDMLALVLVEAPLWIGVVRLPRMPGTMAPDAVAGLQEAASGLFAESPEGLGQFCLVEF